MSTDTVWCRQIGFTRRRVVSGDFDPYREWLDIPPADQPPNYYRLLGLSLYEGDCAAIAHAGRGAVRSTD